MVMASTGVGTDEFECQRECEVEKRAVACTCINLHQLLVRFLHYASFFTQHAFCGSLLGSEDKPPPQP